MAQGIRMVQSQKFECGQVVDGRFTIPVYSFSLKSTKVKYLTKTAFVLSILSTFLLWNSN